MSQFDTLRQNLTVQILSGYSLLYLVSFEETRVGRMLFDVAKRNKRQFYTWNIVDGLTLEGNAFENTTDAQSAIRHIAESLEHSIVLMHDLHRHLEDAHTVRALRNSLTALGRNKVTIAIVAPTVRIPLDIEKDIYVIDIPLPTREELIINLQMLVSSLKDNTAEPTPTDYEELANAALGLTEREAMRVFSKLAVLKRGFTRDDVDLVIEEKRQVIRKTKMLTYIEPREGFNEVGGMKDLKQWLTNRREAFGEKARQFGLPAPKGLLVLGVQGCGKSLVSKAVMKLWKLPLLLLDMGAIFGSRERSAEENMMLAMRTAESLAPCILWIDEIEKGFSGVSGASPGGSSSGAGVGGAEGRTFSFFLTWLQEKQVPVFVIATANSIENLPPEILRKGRFDEIFFVDLPADQERLEILKIHMVKRNRKPDDFDLHELVGRTKGYSGAEIEEAIIAALYYAFAADREINQQDLVRAIDEVIPLWETARERIDYLKDWAENRARFASWGLKKGQLDFSLSDNLQD
jgi:SpoVK/Ycf46/Vps4 family AAA+-type ATPase